MCLKAIVWVTLPLDQHDMPTYQFMKFLPVQSSATPSGGAIVGRLVPLLSPSSREGDEKRRLDDATEYSSGWVSPSFGGNRWPTLAAAETFTSPTSTGAAEHLRQRAVDMTVFVVIRWSCEGS